MDKRTLFYWGKLFNEKITKGEDYKNLKKVITINILDFDYINLDKFHTKFHLWEDELKELMEMDADIKRAEERLEYLSSDEKTIEIYKARENSLHERANMISSAKDEGRQEGIIKTAKNLLGMGIEVELISKATGLSVGEVKHLRN